ncbi:hypothetical protein RFI_22508, partial [Reticulomyxa filosa]
GGNVNYSLDYVQASMIGLMYGSCCQLVNYLEIEILPLYVPSNEEKGNPKLYCKRVQTYMANHKQYVTTPHTAADHFLVGSEKCWDALIIIKTLAWADEHPKYNADNIICGQVSDETGLRQSCVLPVCQEFARLDKDKDGVLSSYEYAQMLSLNDKHCNCIVRTLANKVFSFVAWDDRNYWSFVPPTLLC